MKKMAILLLSLTSSLSAWADISLEPLLNQVTLNLHAEQWVTTKTALVTAVVNAAVADQGIEKIQSEVMQNLTQFSANGDWHIVSFERQQDKSGLETIQITAQSRLPQTDLANLRSKAKAMSKPGETFTISNVQFIPSDDEIKQANTALRANIYNQAKSEIDMLNQLYPDQKYYLHRIDFVPMLLPAPLEANMMMSKVSAVSMPQAPSLAVGNKQLIQATVTLAAMPEQVAQRLTRPGP